MEMIKMASAYAVPVIFASIVCFGLYKEVKVFEAFVEGAREGISKQSASFSACRTSCCDGVFQTSGALDLLCIL